MGGITPPPRGCVSYLKEIFEYEVLGRLYNILWIVSIGTTI